MFGYNLLKKLDGASFKFSLNEEYICVLSNNKVILYSLENLEKVEVIRKPSHPGFIKVSPQNNLLFIKNTSGSIWVYDLENFKQINKFISRNALKLCENEFSMSFRSESIFDIVETNNGNQIIIMDIFNDEKRPLTNFENIYMKFNCSSKELQLHFYTLTYLVEGYEQNKLIVIDENNEETFVSLIKNENLLHWDDLVFCRKRNGYIVLNDRNLLFVDSDFKEIIWEKTLATNPMEFGYFNGIKVSNCEGYLLLTFSNAVVLIEIDNTENIQVEYIKYASCADFSKDDQYLLIGTWEKGLILERG